LWYFSQRGYRPCRAVGSIHYSLFTTHCLFPRSAFHCPPFASQKPPFNSEVQPFPVKYFTFPPTPCYHSPCLPRGTKRSRRQPRWLPPPGPGSSSGFLCLIEHFPLSVLESAHTKKPGEGPVGQPIMAVSPSKPQLLPAAKLRGERSGRHRGTAVSPFAATLTRTLQLTEKTTTLSPALATLTRRVRHKSFACHPYKKQGVGVTSFKPKPLLF
jgi:hypothetical protein